VILIVSADVIVLAMMARARGVFGRRRPHEPAAAEGDK
jgi:hypothetical protein